MLLLPRLRYPAELSFPEVQRKQHGDVVALLSEDGREVEILEILMQAPLRSILFPVFSRVPSDHSIVLHPKLRKGLHATIDQRPILKFQAAGHGLCCGSTARLLARLANACADCCWQRGNARRLSVHEAEG